MSCSLSLRGKLSRGNSLRVDKVNGYFIRKVLSSKLFSTRLIQYTNNILLQEQKAEIAKKLFNLCKKWQSERMDGTLELYKITINKIRKDPKFKLPWTLTEIIKGIERFKKNFKLGSAV